MLFCMESSENRETGTTTAVVLAHLAGLRTGDEKARDELLKAAQHRLRLIARKMFNDFRRLRAWEETDDIVQTAMLRLHNSLAEVTPSSSREFFGLASTQIRRTLVDLARHYYGPQGHGSNLLVPGASASSSTAMEKVLSDRGEPIDLVAWAEFHEYVQAAPPEDRELFDLLWYQGLKPKDAADMLGINERTLRQRWTAAKLRFHTRLKAEE